MMSVILLLEFSVVWLVETIVAFEVLSAVLVIVQVFPEPVLIREHASELGLVMT